VTQYYVEDWAGDLQIG